jgi:hypothetical protein
MYLNSVKKTFNYYGDEDNDSSSESQREKMFEEYLKGVKEAPSLTKIKGFTTIFNKYKDYIEDLSKHQNEDHFDIKEQTKKEKIDQIISFIFININLVIQVIMIIFVIILMKRIKSKRDLGNETSIQTGQSREKNKKKSRDKKNNQGIQDLSSIQRIIKKNKTKKDHSHRRKNK